MNIEVDYKALPKFNWGQQWVRPDGDLSVVVVVHEPFDEPTYLHEAFPNSGAPILNATGSTSERELKSVIQERISDSLRVAPDKQCVIVAHHAFIFNLVQSLDFRPDMFYLYDKVKGYRRLTDCTPIVLRHTQNYARMYIAGAFDQE